MTIKYLKDVSVVSGVREVDLDHINYARYNTYQHVRLSNLLLNISIKKRKELLTYFAQAISDIHTVKKLTKIYIFTARCKNFTTCREIDKEVADGFFHAEEVGNQTFLGFSLRKVSGW